jgi:D-2-hydroxyacid dehydrogenase (NADP+)
MPKPRMLVVDRDCERYRAALSGDFPEVDITAARSYADAAPLLPEVRILATMGVPLPGIRFTADVAALMPRLAWVQCLISGSEHIRRGLAGRDEVLVTTVAGIHGPQMSEMALLHMLALARGLPAMLRNQGTRTWQRMPQLILEAKTVGIVGTGAVGTHLAGVCQAFGMRVDCFTRTVRPIPGADRVFPREELARIAPELDFLVLVVPADAGTRHLVDAGLLAAMKPTAYLVSLGRGAVVDEEALARALREGTIAGAGLDVFDVEPLPTDSPLWGLGNVIVTPHAGGHHDRSPEQALTVLGPNLRAYLDGRPDQMINLVHPGRTVHAGDIP